MALGFGKKKNETDAAPAAAPAQDGSDFDSETFSLESFAADLESAGSSSAVKPPPEDSGSTSTGDALAWDDTALLNFDDPNAFSSTPSIDRRGGGHEATPFDDLARELEDIPGLSDQFPPPAVPVVTAAPAPAFPEPERKTHRRAVSANLSEAIAEATPQEAGDGKKKKEKPAKAIAAEDGAKRKPPLVPIIAVAAVLLVGGGAAFMLTQGGAPPEDTAVTETTSSNPADTPPDTPPAAPPAAEAPLTPEVKAQLKALWDKGAAAKQKKDYAAARTAWEEILRLRPGHPGVQEAIDKLPKA